MIRIPLDFSVRLGYECMDGFVYEWFCGVWHVVVGCISFRSFNGWIVPRGTYRFTTYQDARRVRLFYEYHLLTWYHVVRHVVSRDAVQSHFWTRISGHVRRSSGNDL